MFDFYKTLKDIALANVLEPDSEAYYRSICRWYSTTFSTPLHVVMYELDFSDVLLHYFEHFYEKRLGSSEEDEEAVWIEAMRTINPDFDEEEEESVQEFIRMLEDEQAAKDARKAAKAPQPVVRTYEEVQAIAEQKAPQPGAQEVSDPIQSLLDLPEDE